LKKKDEPISARSTEKKMVTGCHKFRVEELYYWVTSPDLGCAIL
jgi:hypothetical protein